MSLKYFGYGCVGMAALCAFRLDHTPNAIAAFVFGILAAICLEIADATKEKESETKNSVT